MRISNSTGCKTFPCLDINRANYILPEIDVDPNAIKIVMISEAAPADLSDYYYAFIARRAGQDRVIPAGSTYKIRGGEFYFRGARALPSYLQVGPSFDIEKSKRRMIAEDIAAALLLAKFRRRDTERAVI